MTTGEVPRAVALGRLPLSTFQYNRQDVERLRSGYYSDQYLPNTRRVLDILAEQRYRLPEHAFGRLLRELEADPSLSDEERRQLLADVDVGNVEVEAQIFARRQPLTVAVGVDEALSILRLCTGYVDEEGRFVNTWRRLQVWACRDGDVLPYGGNARHVTPGIVIRGRYRDFCTSETPVLGVLTTASGWATNVFNAYQALERQLPILFFPARFMHWKVQSIGGYAYEKARQAYVRLHRFNQSPIVSTPAQAAWWGGGASGTVPHALIACFGGDSVEAMYQFCAVMDPAIPRVALVDFTNDTVTVTLDVLDRLWPAYVRAWRAGDQEGMQRFKLYGVRPDNSANLIDAALASDPSGVRENDFGVNPRLVARLRAAIDSAWRRWGPPSLELLEEAKRYCAEVRILPSGGFNTTKIRLFEDYTSPVGGYAVGSSLLSNCSNCGTNTDWTQDVVRIHLKAGRVDRWVTCAKVGRQPGPRDHLEQVPLDLWDDEVQALGLGN